MCKFYAHHKRCPHMMKNDKCDNIHDKYIRNAHDKAVERKINREKPLNKSELMELLQNESGLTNENLLKLRIDYFLRYVTPPT